MDTTEIVLGKISNRNNKYIGIRTWKRLRFFLSQIIDIEHSLKSCWHSSSFSVFCIHTTIIFICSLFTKKCILFIKTTFNITMFFVIDTPSTKHGRTFCALHWWEVCQVWILWIWNTILHDISIRSSNKGFCILWYITPFKQR